MRILLDTNILISGFMANAGPPGMLLLAWLDDDAFDLVTSQAQLAELRRVLQYPHIRHRVSEEQADDFALNIDTKAIVVEPDCGIDVSPDPDDNIILATAIAGNADLIVSGDKRDMLAIGPVRGIPIVTARDAISLLEYPGTTP